MIQEWSDAFQIPAVINRFSCLAGPWQWGKSEQGWVAWWLIAHRLGLPLTYIGYKGKQVRDVLFINDLCDLLNRQVNDLEPEPEVFNVGGGVHNTLSLVECTDYAQEITGCTVPITTEERPRRADFCVYISDIRKVSKRYNWMPTTPIYQGLEAVDKWVVDHQDLLRGLYA
jgi:CDP-paratose 2-epimerase